MNLLDWISELVNSILDLLSDSFLHVISLHFDSNYIYLAIFIMCFVTLFAKRKEHTKGYLLFGVFSSFVIMFMLIPSTQSLFDRIPSTNEPVFARLWILCPIWLIVIYSFVNWIFANKKDNSNKEVGIVLLSALLIVSGSSLTSNNMLNNTVSAYKVKSESVEIADEILQLNNDNPTTVFILVPYYSEGENYINGGTLNMGIQQYTGKIRILPYKCSEDFWCDFFLSDATPTNRDAEEWLGAFVSEWHEATGYEYLAVPSNDIVERRLADLGYDCISTTAGYNIYRM